MKYSKELTASLMLADAVVSTSEGNWVFSDCDFKKYGVEVGELREIVDTINKLYPDALLDDPLENSEPDELNIMLAGEWTLSYWEDKEPLCGAPATAILYRLTVLNESFERYVVANRQYLRAINQRDNAERTMAYAKEDFEEASRSFINSMEGVA